MTPSPLDDEVLLDARIKIQNWLNQFAGMDEESLRDYFGERELHEATWDNDGEEEIALEYECHDYTISFYLFEGEVINASFQTMQGA